jgi:hypothetical protein
LVAKEKFAAFAPGHLAGLGEIHVSVIERDTAREHESSLAAARHVVLATPLAGYAERACELILSKSHS